MPTGADAAALSGLKAAGQKFTYIGDNVANSSTFGYKRGQAKFGSVVAGVSNSKSFAAGGVKATPLRLANEQGLLESTASASDLAISGAGFLVVGKMGELPPGATNEYSFTRAGSFSADKLGFLCNTAGHYLQAWRTDASGVPVAQDLNSLANLETVRVNQIAGMSTPTTGVDLKINLSADVALGAQGSTERTPVTIYNSLGESSALVCNWTKTSMNPLTWSLSISNAAAAAITQADGPNAGQPYTIDVVFDGNGLPLSYGGAPTPPAISVTWNSAAVPSTVALNLGTVGTANGISCRAGPYAATSVSQNGQGVGQFTEVDISVDGIVSARFSNGQSLKIYKIPLANFASPQQLASKNGNLWEQTDASGGFLLASAKTAGMGSVTSYALEQSTVELADELTEMMGTERYYSGCIKVIQATENMFNDLKQLNR